MKPRTAIAEDLFFASLEEPESQRSEFVRARCGDDLDLREQVLRLLDADAAVGEQVFLKSAFLGCASPDLEPLPQANKAGRFKVLSRHQEGGLGEVLVALDRQFNREVAIKQIKPQWRNHAEARQRFIQEAEVTGRLEHPGIVPVYAMETWPDGRHYYAMRFIEGETLGEAITGYHRSIQAEESSPTDPASSAGSTHELVLRQLLGNFVDVCNTIGYAHSRHVLHRDLKPSNIMVGPYGETLVVDWGLAKCLDAPHEESVTQAIVDQWQNEPGSAPGDVGAAIGTPQYMSPEQAGGRLDEISTRTDIYLLGSTLYEILTGVPPHRDDSIKRLLPRIEVGDFPLPREVNKSIPRPLEAICLKSMARRPVDRYRSVAELANDIESFLADQPVSVHRDSMFTRAVRWTRRHPAVAYSAAVAITLVTLGSISGSIAWNSIQAKQFRIERENNVRTIALDASIQRRLLERRTAAEGAAELAVQETSADRYSSALSVLSKAIDELEGEPELNELQNQLVDKAVRLSRIVDFYQYAEETALYNVLSRDSRGISACRSSLESLGIWDREDWWNHLPDADLSTAQSDRLRWDVYQQWMLLDAMLVKTAGTRLTGIGRITRDGGLFTATRRFLRTDAGVSESKSVEVVSRRIESFAPSEAARWYRRAAEFRLMKSSRLPASELGLTKNAVDSHSMAVLSMIAALDPMFKMFFRDYQGDDDLVTARNLFLRASAQRPDHYWTSLSLAQVEYWLAERDGGDDVRKYDAAIQAAGRCIALDPDNCFAYADRSSIYRAQARLFAKQPSLAPEQHQARITEIQKWSLADAITADRLAKANPDHRQFWVGWQHGLALYEMDQLEEATERFRETSRLTLAMVPSVDASFVRADDMRGRSEAAEIVQNLARQYPDDAKYPALLASIRLSQGQTDAASDAAGEALKRSVESADAHAVAGWLALRAEQPSEQQIASAAGHFNETKRIDPAHPWIDQGIGRCFEHQDLFHQSLAAYTQAFARARQSEHRAAACLGQARVLAAMARYDEAMQAITRARVLEPSTDLKLAVIRPIAIRYGAKYRSTSDENASKDSASKDNELTAMKQFLQSLLDIPQASDFVIPNSRGEAVAVE